MSSFSEMILVAYTGVLGLEGKESIAFFCCHTKYKIIKRTRFKDVRTEFYIFWKKALTSMNLLNLSGH